MIVGTPIERSPGWMVDLIEQAYALDQSSDTPLNLEIARVSNAYLDLNLIRSPLQEREKLTLNASGLMTHLAFPDD